MRQPLGRRRPTGGKRDERRGALWECEARRRFAVASGPPASALRRRMPRTLNGFPEMNVRMRPLNLAFKDLCRRRLSGA